MISNFIPATYLVKGVQGIMLHGQGMDEVWKWVLALVVAAAVGLVVGMKLFRWEKEEKIQPSAKMWILVALIPFFVLGAYYAYTGTGAPVAIRTAVPGSTGAPGGEPAAMSPATRRRTGRSAVAAAKSSDRSA